jgi:hypothetical protein
MLFMFFYYEFSLHIFSISCLSVPYFCIICSRFFLWSLFEYYYLFFFWFIIDTPAFMYQDCNCMSPSQETGECVGTVVNVFDNGGNDLLQVMLYTSSDVPGGTGKSKPAEAGVSGHLAWVPFVEAIVPDVNMNEREMRITPPKGLLELNLRQDERSKKERRELVRHIPLCST